MYNDIGEQPMEFTIKEIGAIHWRIVIEAMARIPPPPPQPAF